MALIMTTPLFPPNDGPITIRQGRGGDCYLLAAVDCLLSTGPEGYAALKSLFVERVGGVEVRIKRTDQSALLQLDKIPGKFIYYYDPKTNQDVFFIDYNRLNQIDLAPEGVKSNSLAIKILERLSSYYYLNQGWNPQDPAASVMAHNMPYRHVGYETAFVAKLLGINSQDYLNIYDIVKLKAIRPEEPVYVALDWGEVDVYGQRHGCHALRIDKIIPNAMSPGGYDVVLVNPWDNEKLEYYSLLDLIQRRSRFATFSSNPYHLDITRTLLGLHENIGKAIYTHPHLLHMLFKIREGNGLLPPNVIVNCVNLHEQMPHFPVVFNSLSIEKQGRVSSCILNYNGNIKAFLNSLRLADPSLDSHIFELIYGQAAHDQGIVSKMSVDEAQRAIIECAKEIAAIPVSFKDDIFHENVASHLQKMTKDLLEFVSHSKKLDQAKQVLGFPVGQDPQVILEAINKKKQTIKESAQTRLDELQKGEVESRIKEINDIKVSFGAHLKNPVDVQIHRLELELELMKLRHRRSWFNIRPLIQEVCDDCQMRIDLEAERAFSRMERNSSALHRFGSFSATKTDAVVSTQAEFGYK